MHTIDIVTITFNNYEGLLKTEKSVALQDYHWINWIVIDGKSSDGTIDFMEGKAKNSLINTTFLSEEDLGIYDAMNKGIDLSKADYTLFLNAGDELHDGNTLTKIFSNLGNAPSIIYGDYYRELKNGELDFVKAKPMWYIYHSLPTSHQAIFYKRRSIKNLRYSLNYKVSSDYFFTAKLIKIHDCIRRGDYLLIQIPVAIFEYNGLSRTNLPILYKDAFIVQKEVLNMSLIFRILSYIFKLLRNKLI